MSPNKKTDAGFINPIVFTPSMLISSSVDEDDYPVWMLGAYGIEDKVISPQTHRIYECMVAHVGVAVSATAVVTISIATAALVSWNNHGLPEGAEVRFATAGTLPTGIVADVKYYVLAPTTNAFNLSATIGGAPIATTGIQSGQHKCSVKSTLPHESSEGEFAKWEDVGATNKYAMFDEKWGTQTKALNSLTIVLAPGIVIDSIGLLNLKGKKVEIFSRVGGVVKLAKTLSLTSNDGINDWGKYLLTPPVAKRDIIVNDLLPYGAQELTITITGPGQVGIGNISMGMYVTLGKMQWRAKAGAVNFGTKTKDRWGNLTFEEGEIVKRFGASLEVPTDFVDELHAIFMSVLNKIIVLTGAGNRFSCLTAWGTLNDFEVDIAYTQISYCSFTFEGIV